MILRHARVRRVRDGSHYGKFIGWHLKGFRYAKNGVHGGHGYAIRTFRTPLGPKSYLDKKTEYIDGIVIRHP